jgi:hypothetical protein
VASSSEATRLLELFELQAQEGPCVDAFRTGEPVGHEDLVAGSGRWPSFSAAALRAGFTSASALPLRLREVTLGAMNLLRVTPAPMGEADVIVARALVDLAAVSIVQHRVSTEAQRLNEQLSAALTSPVVIEQAKGVICERAGVGPGLSQGALVYALGLCEGPQAARACAGHAWCFSRRVQLRNRVPAVAYSASRGTGVNAWSPVAVCIASRTVTTCAGPASSSI